MEIGGKQAIRGDSLEIGSTWRGEDENRLRRWNETTRAVRERLTRLSQASLRINESLESHTVL